MLVDNASTATNTTFTALPAFAASTENLKKTSWTAQNKARISMVTNAYILSLTLNANAYLELAGQTLTVDALTVTNKSFHSGIYTASASPLFSDAIGGGKVVVLAHGTTAFFR